MNPIPFLPSFLKMLSALAIVIGIMVGAMYFFKRVMQQTTAGADAGQAINIVAARYLGPRSSIMLVEILGQVVAIGVSHNQMSLLTTISDADALERLKGIQRQTKRLPPLTDYLRRSEIVRRVSDLMGKGNPKK
jgi:flagellar biosynthetic protein FliO